MLINNSIKLLILLILFNLQTPCQLVFEGFAPLQPGNFWKYVDNEGFYYGCFVTDSTVEINGKEFYVVKLIEGTFVRYRYCTLTPDSFYAAYTSGDSLFKYLKYNCQLGDSWNTFYMSYPIMLSVIGTGSIPFHGKFVNAKHVFINEGLIQIHYLWNDTLGLLKELHEAQVEFNLVGCVINGIAYGDTTFVTSVREENIKVEHFTLEQNYPNPFNPTTIIKYSVASASLVTLKVYDVLGNEIAALVNEEKPPGIYTTEFNGAGISSGVYFYRLSAGDRTDIKKMIMMK